MSVENPNILTTPDVAEPLCVLWVDERAVLRSCQLQTTGVLAAVVAYWQGKSLLQHVPLYLLKDVLRAYRVVVGREQMAYVLVSLWGKYYRLEIFSSVRGEVQVKVYAPSRADLRRQAILSDSAGALLRALQTTYASEAARARALLALGGTLLEAKGAAWLSRTGTEYQVREYWLADGSAYQTDQLPDLPWLPSSNQQLRWHVLDTPDFLGHTGGAVALSLPEGVLYFSGEATPTPPPPALGEWLGWLGQHFSPRAEEGWNAQDLAVLSHELRTPLNTIVNVTRLLQQENPAPKQEEYLQAISVSADNTLALIRDVLDVSRLDAGQPQSEPRPFDLRRMLRGLRQVFRQRAQEKNLRLSVQVDVDLPTTVLGDELRLNQVLTNLLGNAIKFTQTGRVALVADVLNREADQVLVRFEVSDTGPGIPPDQLDAIFEPYRQLGDASQRAAGTGLGLSITQRLVKLQGGQLSVESTEGEGTTFSVALPFGQETATPHAPAKAASASVPPAETAARPRVLVAEDDYFNQLVARKLLTLFGAEVDTVENGEEALRAVSARPYALVLMDLQMPGTNGYETARQLRQHPDGRVRQTPIVAISAMEERQVADRLAKSGFDGFLSKPFSAEELEAVYLRLARRETAELTDFSYLEMISDERNDFLRQALAQMLAQMSQYEDQLRAVATSSDVKAFRAHTHKIKSTFNTLKVRAFQELTADVEDEGRETDAQALNRLVDQLLDLNRRAVAEVQAKLATLNLSATS